MDVAATPPTLASAIMRSRAARARQQARRRRRRIGLTAAVALGLSAGTLLTIGGVTGSDPVMAAVTQVKSLADLISQRSPGQRTSAVLTKHKSAQRALPKMRLPSTQLPTPSATELAKLLLPSEAPLPVTIGQPVPLAMVSPPSLAEILTPTSGGGGTPVVSAPGGGGSTPGGGSGGPPIATPPNNPLVPTPAVPEPATWAMMLLGFGLIGWRARHAAAAAAPTPALRLA